MYIFDKKAFKEALKLAARSPLKDELSGALRSLERDPDSKEYTSLDLRFLFSAPTELTRDNLKVWHASVISELNKSRASSASLLLLLLKKIEGQGEDVQNPEFWVDLVAARQDAIAARLTTTLRNIGSEYPLQATTLSHLENRLESLGLQSVTPQKMVKAAEDAGLQVISEVTLPEEGIPKNLQMPWKAVMAYPEFSTIIDLMLLHDPQRTERFTVIRGLTAGGKTITTADVESALHRSETSRDSKALPSAQKFLGVLRNVDNQGELQEIAVQTLVSQISQKINSGLPLVAIRNVLADIGLDRGEATRLVFAVSTSTNLASHQASAAPTALDISQALVAADLDGAIRIADMLREQSDDPDIAAAIQQVEDAKRRKQAALASYREASVSRDYDRAAQALDEALRIHDDEDIAEKRDQLPPAQPLRIQTRIIDQQVVVNWVESPNSSVTHTLVRTVGKAATHSHEGTILIRETQGAEFIDNSVPWVSPVYYSLFAKRGSGMYSDPRSTQEPLFVVPSPAKVTVSTTATGLSVSWQRLPMAAAVIVEITDNDGHTQSEQTSQQSSVFFGDLVTGMNYLVKVTAVYSGASGKMASEPLLFRATPRGHATQVTDFQVTPEENPSGPASVRATWTEQFGYDIQIWELPRGFELADRQKVKPDFLESQGGVRLTPLSKHSRNSQVNATFPMPNDVVKFIAALATDEKLMLGEPVLVGAAPVVTGVETTLLGADLQISFIWPEGNHNIEAIWNQHGVEQIRRISRVDYRRNSGVILKDSVSIDTIRLVTVADLEGQRLRSKPVTVPYSPPQRTVSISYRLDTRKSFFGGKYTCTITADTDVEGVAVTGQLMLKPGSIMPVDPADGIPVGSVPLNFISEKHIDHVIELGKQTAPFWLQLVIDDPGITIKHPGTQEMKVIK